MIRLNKNLKMLAMQVRECFKMDHRMNIAGRFAECLLKLNIHI